MVWLPRVEAISLRSSLQAACTSRSTPPQNSSQLHKIDSRKPLSCPCWSGGVKAHLIWPDLSMSSLSKSSLEERLASKRWARIWRNNSSFAPVPCRIQEEPGGR